MKPFYLSVTKPRYLQYELMPNDALPVLKTNVDLIEQVLEHFNSLDKKYFVYFLDGDSWGQRNEWKNNRFVDKYDFQLSNEFFRIPLYKDSIFLWTDEFIIINPCSITKDIDSVLMSKDFTMTKLIYCSEKIDFQTIAKLSYMVRIKKLINPGAWHLIDEKELLNFEYQQYTEYNKCNK